MTDRVQTTRSPSTVLERIVARTRADLARRQAREPLAAVEDALVPSTRDFAGALREPGPLPRLIAEFKPRSPSRGEIRPGATPAQIVPSYARYAAAISVLCDVPFFGGGYDKLAASRALCDVPILCKDFVVSRYQVAEARRAGADAILLMASVLDDPALIELLGYARALGMEPLVETHDDDELDRVLSAGAVVVGVNSRDLRTLAIDRDAMLRRLERVPSTHVRVAESGVEHASDVATLIGRAEAVLVGSSLMAAPDISARIEELGWHPR